MKCKRCNQNFAGNKLFVETEYENVCSECLSDKEKKMLFDMLDMSMKNEGKALKEVMTIQEASDKYNKHPSTLRRNFANSKEFREGIDVKQSGKVWLVTKKAMDRYYKKEE